MTKNEQPDVCIKANAMNKTEEKKPHLLLVKKKAVRPVLSNNVYTHVEVLSGNYSPNHEVYFLNVQVLVTDQNGDNSLKMISLSVKDGTVFGAKTVTNQIIHHLRAVYNEVGKQFCPVGFSKDPETGELEPVIKMLDDKGRVFNIRLESEELVQCFFLEMMRALSEPGIFFEADVKGVKYDTKPNTYFCTYFRAGDAKTGITMNNCFNSFNVVEQVENHFNIFGL